MTRRLRTKRISRGNHISGLLQVIRVGGSTCFICFLSGRTWLALQIDPPGSAWSVTIQTKPSGRSIGATAIAKTTEPGVTQTNVWEKASGMLSRCCLENKHGAFCCCVFPHGSNQFLITEPLRGRNHVYPWDALRWLLLCKSYWIILLCSRLRIACFYIIVHTRSRGRSQVICISLYQYCTEEQ